MIPILIVLSVEAIIVYSPRSFTQRSVQFVPFRSPNRAKTSISHRLTLRTRRPRQNGLLCPRRGSTKLLPLAGSDRFNPPSLNLDRSRLRQHFHGDDQPAKIFLADQNPLNALKSPPLDPNPIA